MKAEELQKRREEKETRVIIREIMERLNAKEKEEKRWKNPITTEYTKNNIRRNTRVLARKEEKEGENDDSGI